MIEHQAESVILNEKEIKVSKDGKVHIVGNSDNAYLQPAIGGGIIIGFVDEVNGEGGQEIQDFAPTRDELLQLVKYWWRRSLEIDWCIFNTGITGTGECQLSMFANRRINRIAGLLGEEATNGAIDEVTTQFRDRQEQGLKLWQIFKYGDSTKWNEVGVEFERMTCEWKSGEPKWAYASRMVLTSSAFSEGESIPDRFVSEGKDLSPPLSWSQPPVGTLSLAITMCDLDGSSIYDHWVVFNIPSDCLALEEGISHEEHLPNGALQGKNMYEKIGYSGPSPMAPFHRYQFNIYALDRKLDLTAGISRTQLLDAIEGHIIDDGQLTAIYRVPLQN